MKLAEAKPSLGFFRGPYGGQSALAMGLGVPDRAVLFQKIEQLDKGFSRLIKPCMLEVVLPVFYSAGSCNPL